MSKGSRTHATRRPAHHPWFHISKRLTPKERQAFGLVLGLFLLGMLVRWYRLAHLR